MKHYSSTAVDRTVVEEIDAKQTAQIKKIYRVLGIALAAQSLINFAVILYLMST